MKLSYIRQFLNQMNWFIVVFTLLVFAGLIKLGLWQTSRAVEKEVRLSKIASYQNQQAISLSKVLALKADGENINDIPLHLTGTFDAEKIFLLDNQTNNGKLGYRVLQILYVGEQAILVNLGWVQGFIERDKLPEVTPLTGEYQFFATTRLVESGIVLAQQDYHQITWPLRIQQIELDKISQVIGQKLLPFVAYLDKKEGIGYEKNWHPIVMPPEKHRAYAFQWFSLALAWMILMISASLWSFKNKLQ